MATLVLSIAGQAIGAAVGGPVGAVVGRAAGALAGQAIDQRLFATHNKVEAARLADLDVQSSTEGASIPRIYGRARLSGQIVWATRFEEVVSDDTQGGKGGGGSTTTVRSYSYYGNFAVALCEGPISHIGRIWADGKLLDTRDIALRTYLGSQTQEPDPLIEAKQGTGNAPAYRGAAYIVFERLPLDGFGNRLPQIAVEVVRAIDRLEPLVKAVTVTPGAGEFVYADVPVTVRSGPGTSASVNRHVAHAGTDWQASIDELQALCPNLESVALVVSWFATDLRCDVCEIRPAVEDYERTTSGMEWSVAGLTRAAAPLVSREGGRPAYGGTPSDASVVAAIVDLKTRGLKVMLYPFVLMDIPSDNTLPDPYGGATQAAYPWRGRITCHPAPGVVGSPDKSTAATDQVADFVGSAAIGDFHQSGGTIAYDGPSEWSWRRFILHYAHLAQAAGGVDALLIGSEMVALTSVRSTASKYPFVDALTALAGDVREIVGDGTLISYAADWSEYASHQPQDGSGDVYFHLDPLWASADIDFVGVDMYAPLSDWRDGEHTDAQAWPDPYALGYLRSNIAGGEDFDWYYASDADRQAGMRTPISDGAYDKAWVYRAKDLVGWWSNPHFNRPGGVEESAPSVWVPASKPIRFCEIGLPAIDRGTNQPNVFYDPKSAESALPVFSNGARDDAQQRKGLEAVLSWWGDGHPAFDPGENPMSGAYGAPMVDPSSLFLWAWDARPWPAFPLETGVWADSANWRRGHWLNGRLGGMGLDGLVSAVLADFGIDDGDVDLGEIAGALDGFVIPDPTSARSVLERLSAVFGFVAVETGSRMAFRAADHGATLEVSDASLAETDEQATLITATRAQESEMPLEVRLGFTDPMRDYARVTVRSRRLAGASRRVTGIDLNISAAPGVMQVRAEQSLRDAWAARERYAFALSPGELAPEPGDLLRLEDGTLLRVTSIEDGPVRRIEATSAAPDTLRAVPPSADFRRPLRAAQAAAPEVAILDLPLLKGDEPPAALRVAAFARPWRGGMTVWRSASGEGFTAIADIARPATIGELSSPLPPGPQGRWDMVNALDVTLYGGTFSARAEQDVFAGANVLAVRCASGGYEVLQFAQSQLVGVNAWRLTRLLRAQAGTDAEMASGAEVGATVVLITPDLPLVDAGLERLDLALQYRIGPRGLAIDDPTMIAREHAASGVALRPLSPAHLTARRDGAGDIAFGWIRRTRMGGDGWEQREVPLGEDSEAYEVDILSEPGGAVLRTITTDTPAALYTTAAQTNDFGAPPDTICVSLYQVSATRGRGAARSAVFHV